MQFTKRQIAMLYVLFFIPLFYCKAAFSGTLYLPLKLSPEIEARIEKLFILADMPIIKRPIPINDVLKALDKIEGENSFLSQGIYFYLERFNNRVSLTHTSVQYGTGNSDGAAHVIDNARGLTTNNRYALTLQGYAIVSDHIAINAGLEHRRGSNGSNTDFEGTFISFGWDSLQFDIGYKPHWLGPFQHGDLLISTNAPTPLGITVSNSKPLDFFNLRYEFALLETSESDRIQSINDPSLRLSGRPKIFSSHLSFEPFDGFALGFNRVLQFGGGDRKESPTDILDAFFSPSSADNIGSMGTEADNDFGNQLSSINARYISQSRIPFSVYMSYGGEDTSAASKVHFGNTALMLGVHLPHLPYHLDLTVETAQFQNAWYVNNNYGDGYTHENSVIGHWAANFRRLGDARDMQSHIIKLAWDAYSGLAFSGGIKQVKTLNALLPESDAIEVVFDTSIAYKESIIGLSLRSGKNVNNERYSFLSGAIRW